jgi:hypothetical protein
VLGAVFKDEPPSQGRRLPLSAQMKVKLRRRLLAHDDHRRDDLAPLRGEAGVERLLDFGIGCRRDVHCREQRAQGLFGHGVGLAPDIVVLQRDAVVLGKARERAHALFSVNLTEQAGSTSLPASRPTGWLA